MRRNWKSVHAKSLLEAMRLCKDFAIETRRLSVERIADLMGVSHDVLYKWLASGRMPANLIPTYEHACGARFVTRWLAASGGQLIIDIPAGRTADTEGMQLLQEQLHGAVGALLQFYAGRADAIATLGAIQAGLEGLAWHRQNVQQHDQPQLEFGGQA